MCGIIAHLALEEDARISPQALEGLNQLQIHRGPDSSGTFLRNNIALAVRRLSIVDAEKGNQPIFSEDDRYAIVFNGEIYNYEKLRAYLSSQNYPF